MLTRYRGSAWWLLWLWPLASIIRSRTDCSIRAGPGWAWSEIKQPERNCCLFTFIVFLTSLVHSHWSRASLVMLVPAILCHKEPARASKDSWLPCTERSYYRRPYAIKNQRGAGGYFAFLVGGFWMPELVLYCIRVLVKQFLGTVLDIEVDQSDYYLFTSIVFLTSYLTCWSTIPREVGGVVIDLS